MTETETSELNYQISTYIHLQKKKKQLDFSVLLYVASTWNAIKLHSRFPPKSYTCLF